MDYEKEYKKLKAGIKNAYLYAQTNSTKAVLEHILPELRESNGEEIRKLLIRLFTSNANEKFDDVSTEDIIAWLEKQGNADNIELKIEPKFHKGEWVVWQDKFYKVNYNGCGYELIDQNGLSTSLEYGTVDENAHLFTIQDAKDGDVLSYVTNEEDLWIMIYLSLYEPYEGHVHYHALLVNDNFTGKGTCCICINDLKPANKELRDLLFQKMKEAGYEWDAEKKKLRKIELQPSQWNISDFRTWQHIVCDVLTKYWGIGQYLDDGFCKKIAQDMQEEWNKKLCLIQDSAWSEEDEKMLDNCINALGDSSFANTYEIEEWVKSLRQRIGG